MKQHKRLVIVTAFLLSVILLVGGYTILKSNVLPEQYKLIYIPKQIDASNNFWTALIEGAKMAADEYGVKLQVVSGESEEDIDGQNALIKWAIEQQPDALIVSPCSYTESTKLLKEVKKNGIRLVLIDSVVDEQVADLVVSTDNYSAGQRLGIYAKSILPDNKSIAIVGHVEGTSTAIEREAGVRSGLGEDEQYIKDVVFCGSYYGKAYDLAVDLIKKYPDLTMIVGLNEYSAVGVARAIDDLQLSDQIRIVGFDSSIEGIQLMEEGVFQGIVIQKPFNMGYLGIEETVKILNNQIYDKQLDSGSKLITMDNIYTEENQKLLFPFVGTQTND